jgi:hypothetical protein
LDWFYCLIEHKFTPDEVVGQMVFLFSDWNHDFEKNNGARGQDIGRLLLLLGQNKG